MALGVRPLTAEEEAEVRRRAASRTLPTRVDEMGPESARSFPGRQVVPVAAEPGARAWQEIDYGRRG